MKTVDQANLVIVINGDEVAYVDNISQAKDWLLSHCDDETYAEVYEMGSDVCMGSGYVGAIHSPELYF